MLFVLRHRPCQENQQFFYGAVQSWNYYERPVLYLIKHSSEEFAEGNSTVGLRRRTIWGL